MINSHSKNFTTTKIHTGFGQTADNNYITLLKLTNVTFSYLCAIDNLIKQVPDHMICW